MPLKKLPKKLKGLYLLYEGSVKSSNEHGFSPEEAFWIAFAEICPSIVWHENASTEVKLSELLRLYLSIYCEQINPQLTVEKEPAFLELLKERYDKVNWIIFESHQDNYGLATLELGRFILGEEAELFNQILAGMNIVATGCVIEDGNIPLKLIRDV